MALENALLKIRRKFSKNEKYKLLLQYLDDTETNLAKERRLNTDLMKKNHDLEQKVRDLESKNNHLQVIIDRHEEKLRSVVTDKQFEKVKGERNELRKNYKRVVEQNIQLQLQIKKEADDGHKH
jgi:fructose-1-phosphate kinase PfkB-like protein